ncbi:MAG: right-handed parallel beta-helix repeat-containing protein, partial [Candidatus Hodarchaeales archaeon]
MNFNNRITHKTRLELLLLLIMITSVVFIVNPNKITINQKSDLLKINNQFTESTVLEQKNQFSIPSDESEFPLGRKDETSFQDPPLIHLPEMEESFKPILSSQPSVDRKINLKVSATYIEHNPIEISGNVEFLGQATIEDWGTGTVDDPIVIQNYNFTGSGNCDISIQNTDLYFVIQNNLMEQSWNSGIILSNVSNGNISHNIITNKFDGIFILSASSLGSIDNNVLTNNKFGISIINDANVTRIVNNHIIDGTRAIYLNYYSRVGQLIGNTLTKIHENGIYSLRSQLNEIRDNTITGINYDGIYINGYYEFFEDPILPVILQNNTIVNASQHGISLIDYGNNSIVGNNLTNTDFYFLGNLDNYRQWEVTDNFINDKPLIFWQDTIGGTIPSNNGQVILINTTGTTVSNCDFTNAGSLIAAYSKDLVISNNNFRFEEENFRPNNGMELNNVYNSTIRNNLFDRQTASDFGVYMVYSQNNTLSDNTVKNHSSGFYFIQSRNNTLVNNQFRNIRDSGMYLSSSPENIVMNNQFINISGSGVYLSSSPENIVTNNQFINISGSGVYLSSSPDNNIIGNIFENLARNQFYTDELNHGIYLKNSPDNTINENSFTNTDVYLNSG